MSTTSSARQSLHTIGDEGAENYISRSLGDGLHEPLLPCGELDEDLPDMKIDFPEQPSMNGGPSYEQVSVCTTSATVDVRCCMTPVRRMFCLLALFDSCLISLMWIIYSQLKHGLVQTYNDEVVNYDFKKSLFDVVVAAMARTVLLLLTYSCLLSSKKWYVVAFTTTASTILLICKVVLNTAKDGQPMSYLLVIVSFILSWSQAWHFDFQVIPSEMKQSVPLSSLSASLPHLTEQRSYPPARSYISGRMSSAFFTPYSRSHAGRKSSHPSSDESSLSDISEELKSLEDQKHSFICAAKDATHEVFKMLFVTEGWKLEREEKDDIKVQSRQFVGIGKVYKLEALVDCPSKTLGKIFWDDVESQPSWNPNVMQCQVYEKLNSKTDLIYVLASEAAGGLVSSRDFVTVRRRKKKGSLLLCVGVSVETDALPPKENIVRGVNGPGGWVMRDIVGEPNKSQFIWLLNSDLKGWLPQRLIDSSLGGVMVDTMRSLRGYVASLSKH